MNGKVVGAAVVLTGVVAGVAMYWLQVYAFYEPVSAEAPAARMELVALETGAPEPIAIEGFEGIDSDSSPLRFRGCFATPLSLSFLTESFEMYEAAEPLHAPGWFDCFDAARIGADLADGTALPFLSRRDVHPGVDRVIAVYPDGRAYAWHQLNDSAEE